MTLVVLAVAGALAGAVNAAAGGGSLLTFPALLATGLDPLAANVTNTVGLVPGYAGGAAAYRREIAEQRRRVLALLPVAVVGTLAGCVLLLALPRGAFTAIAPWLVLAAVVLLAAQPVLQRRALRQDGPPRPILAQVAALAGGAYATYFGAAVGVVLLALLGVALREDMQRVNALKNAITLVASVIGAAVFVVLAPVDLTAAAVVAVASLVGGRVGGGAARRLPPEVLRIGVVVVGGGLALAMLLG